LMEREEILLDAAERETFPNNQVRMDELAAWQQKLEEKATRLDAERVFDELKGRRLDEWERDIVAKERELKEREVRLGEEERQREQTLLSPSLSSSDKKQHDEIRQELQKLRDENKTLQLTIRDTTSGEIQPETSAWKDMQKQLETANRILKESEKNHDEALQKLHEGSNLQIREMDEENQRLQRHLEQEQDDAATQFCEKMTVIDHLEKSIADLTKTHLEDQLLQKELEEASSELKSEIDDLKEERSSLDHRPHAPKLKKDIDRLKSENRKLQRQLTKEQTESVVMLKKKDDAIAIMQKDAVKLKSDPSNRDLDASASSLQMPIGDMKESPTTVLDFDKVAGNGSLSKLWSKFVAPARNPKAEIIFKDIAEHK
jgi:hypothetical protein